MVELAALPSPLRLDQRGRVGGSSTGTRCSCARVPIPTGSVTRPGRWSLATRPPLVMPVEGTWMLRAQVSAEHESTFDAAVLVVHADERNWAKLCLELSPQGEVMVVSVVTRGDSDDCNSVVVAGPVWLRVARLERAFAFHYSLDGETWRMVRYFGLGTAEDAEVGFLAQSRPAPGAPRPSAASPTSPRCSRTCAPASDGHRIRACDVASRASSRSSGGVRILSARREPPGARSDGIQQRSCT